MRRTLIALIFAAVATVTLAAQGAPESTTQMSLVSSATFTNRLQYLMVQQARVVKAEALATACHAQRSVYATNVINSPAAFASVAAVMIVGGVNLIGTVVPNEDPDLVDSSATDAQIFSQIATYWDALSGCDTGS